MVIVCTFTSLFDVKLMTAKPLFAAKFHPYKIIRGPVGYGPTFMSEVLS